MVIELPRGAGTAEHGFAESLRFEDPADDDVARLDARRVVGIQPLFAVRVQLFVDWHRERGQEVELVEPADPDTAATVRHLGLGRTLPTASPHLPPAPSAAVLLPLVRVRELTAVDDLAEILFPLLVDHFDDVAVVRDAVLMAFSELVQNGVEHGANPLGCVAAVQRVVEQDRRRLTLAIGDLGIGIPEHLRGLRPGLVVDHHAIGTAVQDGVTGTQRPDRGYGFSWVLKETLTSAATAAELFIRSGNGYFRRVIAGGAPRDSGKETSSTPGTWLAHDWTTVGGASHP